MKSMVAGKDNVVTGDDGVIDFSLEQADTLHEVEHVFVGQTLVGGASNVAFPRRFQRYLIVQRR